MINQVVYGALDSLAVKHIPKGKHKLLHVDSRLYWKDIVIDLIETGVVPLKPSILTKCAISWESLIIQKLSSLN